MEIVLLQLLLACVGLFIGGLLIGLALGERSKTEIRLDEDYNTKLLKENIQLRKDLKDLRLYQSNKPTKTEDVSINFTT